MTSAVCGVLGEGEGPLVARAHPPSLGQDPPWDIHMDLPYGTMKDDEMRALPVKELCDDG